MLNLFSTSFSYILVTALVIAIILASSSSGKVDSVLDNGMTLADVQYWGRVDVRAHLFRLKRILSIARSS